MHGLHTIHGINEQAAAHEHLREKKRLKALGLTVLLKYDTLGLVDITTKPIGFETVALAQQSVLGKGGLWKIA